LKALNIRVRDPAEYSDFTYGQVRYTIKALLRLSGYLSLFQKAKLSIGPAANQAHSPTKGVQPI
jgi:hypothetical protein